MQNGASSLDAAIVSAPHDLAGDGIHTRDIPIEVEVRIAGDELVADFAGTAPQQRGNVNCPLSVTRSAVYYVVRAVCDPDIPASGGAFAPVTVVGGPNDGGKGLYVDDPDGNGVEIIQLARPWPSVSGLQAARTP